jgi:hypothetical protein
MLAIKIENQISCEMLCGRIQKLLIDYQKSHTNTNDLFLIVDIKQAQDSTDHIPKLTNN